MPPKKRELIGKKGQKAVLEKYSSKIIAKKYADYYTNILNEAI